VLGVENTLSKAKDITLEAKTKDMTTDAKSRALQTLYCKQSIKNIKVSYVAVTQYHKHAYCTWETPSQRVSCLPNGITWVQ